MDDDEIIMDSATGNGRMIGARFGGKAKTRYLRYVALYDRAAVNGTTDGKRPSYRCAVSDIFNAENHIMRPCVTYVKFLCLLKTKLPHYVP